MSRIETPEIDDIEEETRRGMIDRSIPSAVVDTGATSNVGKYGCNLELTGEPSSKFFTTATGHKAKATEKGRMAHEFRKPARMYNIVPDITLNPIASTSKMCDTDCFLVFDAEEVRIYDARTTKIVASKPPVLKGWREKISTLWRISFVKRPPVPDLGPKANRTPGTRPASSDAQKPFSPIFPAPSETISNV